MTIVDLSRLALFLACHLGDVETRPKCCSEFTLHHCHLPHGPSAISTFAIVLVRPTDIDRDQRRRVWTLWSHHCPLKAHASLPLFHFRYESLPALHPTYFHQPPARMVPTQPLHRYVCLWRINSSGNPQSTTNPGTFPTDQKFWFISWQIVPWLWCCHPISGEGGGSIPPQDIVGLVRDLFTRHSRSVRPVC